MGRSPASEPAKGLAKITGALGTGATYALGNLGMGAGVVAAPGVEAVTDPSD